MTFKLILDSHAALSKRRQGALAKLEDVKNEMAKEEYFKKPALSVFCAGSLARLEAGEKSDLDLFVTADDEASLRSRLSEYTLYAHLIRINADLEFPPFSNDGEYLKLHFIEDLKNRTGSRKDDSENLFTVRMLLMLESRPLINEKLYREHLVSVLKHYYRDDKGKPSFRPLFLLNDLLRYWRTLCLNYEEMRHDRDKPWRKKNINLKFSRMLTVFGTVLPLVVWPVGTAEELITFAELSPLERLAEGLQRLDDNSLLDEWENILNIYESFLSWKEDSDIETFLENSENKKMVAENANVFAAYLYNALTHKKIHEEYRRYLVL